jgi:hypothetical protein
MIREVADSQNPLWHAYCQDRACMAEYIKGERRKRAIFIETLNIDTLNIDGGEAF